MSPSFAEFVTQSKSIILDGALATELERRGCNLDSPIWSAETLIHNPDLILEVHQDYFLAGADIAITASYQASTFGLQQHGLSLSFAKELITKSVELAKQARARVTEVEPGRKCFIAGSVGPYGAFLANGAEYSGDYELSDEDMKDFHRPRIETLITAGVDVLACETIPSFEEMRVLVSLLKEFPTIVCWVSFTLRDESHLSDGTPLSKALALLNVSSQVVAVGVNCVPEDTVTKALTSFSALTQKPLLAYPNSGEIYDPLTKTWSGSHSRGSHLAKRVQEWNKLGAKLIGGCCRTTPDDIGTIKKAFQLAAANE